MNPEIAHNDNESKAVVELPVLPTDDLPADSVDKQDAVPETPSETAENTPNAEEGDNEKPVPKLFITPRRKPNAM